MSIIKKIKQIWFLIWLWWAGSKKKNSLKKSIYGNFESDLEIVLERRRKKLKWRIIGE